MTTEKQPAKARPLRTMAGELMDLHTVAQVYGGTVQSWRNRIARRQVPFRRLAGRIVIIRRELEKFLSDLPGLTPQQISDQASRQ